MGISINSLKRHSTFISRHYNKPSGRSTKIPQEIQNISYPHPLQRDIPPGVHFPMQMLYKLRSAEQIVANVLSISVPPLPTPVSIPKSVSYGIHQQGALCRNTMQMYGHVLPQKHQDTMNMSEESLGTTLMWGNFWGTNHGQHKHLSANPFPTMKHWCTGCASLRRLSRQSARNQGAQTSGPCKTTYSKRAQNLPSRTISLWESTSKKAQTTLQSGLSEIAWINSNKAYTIIKSKPDQKGFAVGFLPHLR